jgi:transposase InsO family protein
VGGGCTARAAAGTRAASPAWANDYLHIAVDDRTRIAYVEPLPDERDATAMGFLARATAFFGSHGIRIERVLTDNGSCYRSKAFNALLMQEGIGHRWTRPYRPQTNGKAERFNLTLKSEWAYRAPYASNQARLDALVEWVHWYNFHRPHMAHRGGTPMSVVNDLPGKHI